jgi:hypothetical protein
VSRGAALLPCAALAALLIACLGYVPDTSKPVSVPYRCLKQLGSYRVKAEACAVENGVTWRITSRWRKRK